MAAYRHISHGFDPVFNGDSRILILGSFPSVLSRKNAFYYGNPQNRFWRVIAHALGESTPPNEGDLLLPPYVNAGIAAEGGADEAGSNAKEHADAATCDAADASAATLEQSIDAKKLLLLSNGIALWDAIEECDIKGSSDASIKNVVPARVELITDAARIDAVICNGATAGRLYKRYLQWKTGLEALVLPSTSPANAAWGLERLQDHWKGQLDEIIASLPDPTAPEERNPKRKASAARERTDYASVRVPAPPASNYAVHKSMQGNKRKDTKPELLVRERLREAGLGGYRLQWKAPGRPDVAWPGKKVCLFINGCFWHRCPHCHPSTPAKNIEYWEAKFARNVERDEKNLSILKADGWKVHVVWECQLKKKTRKETFAQLLPILAEELGKPLATPKQEDAPQAEPGE